MLHNKILLSIRGRVTRANRRNLPTDFITFLNISPRAVHIQVRQIKLKWHGCWCCNVLPQYLSPTWNSSNNDTTDPKIISSRNKSMKLVRRPSNLLTVMVFFHQRKAVMRLIMLCERVMYWYACVTYWWHVTCISRYVQAVLIVEQLCY